MVLSNPVWSVLYQYGRSHWRYFVVGTVAQTIGRVPKLFPTVLVAIAVDSIFLDQEPFGLPLVPDAWLPVTVGGQTVLLLVLITACYPTAAVCNVVSMRQFGRFDQSVQHDIRMGTFDAVQRLEMAYFERKETGQVMSVLNDDVRALGRAVSGVLRTVVQSGTFALVMFGFLFWLNWQLALTLLVVPVVLFWVSLWVSRVLEPKHRAVRRRVGRINDRLNTNIEGISTIKSYSTENVERDRVRTASGEHRDTKWDVKRTSITFNLFTMIVTRGAKLLVLVLGSYWILIGPPLVYGGTLTVGGLYVFYRYADQFSTPMSRLANAVDPYQEAKAAASRLRDLVETEWVPDREGAIDPGSVDGAVEYRDVSFRYSGRDEPVLETVSFSAAPEETVGVVGPTGAGKSTLLKLLFRFYEPEQGRIELDGHDLRTLDIECLRESMGYVGQEPFLFHGTVRENLAYGDPDIDEAEMVRAARLAEAHEFVQSLPDGYETQVGERGVKLSGGQRQRLTIAREILRSPAVLVLDEATSHVDNETEALIQHAIDELGDGRTMFVIAHRLSTVRDADTILVLDDGGLVERGTHEELLAADGLYANLWRIQVGEVESLSESFLDRLQRREVGGR